ncbi:hypothetical protein HMPREF9303_2591 [Prevotella denticola CRIS 18C-A]|uniref:Uncharacterized protein n=1 Tax=Prevotella denticola CRIS 18C-A TaxID=944557 RepID=F0H8U1_9BACT|nr:hypothetical protein HMPREF9303_2591 [Prevotella denticola CRIS 18C-A]
MTARTLTICCPNGDSLRPKKSCAGAAYPGREACFSEGNAELSV